MDVFCSICGRRWDASDLDAVACHQGEWFCTDESACLERKAALTAIMDARDNPVPVLAAREDLEATIWRNLPGVTAGSAALEILAAADRYASAATADHAGLDAILAPGRGEAAVAEAYERKDSQ